VTEYQELDKILAESRWKGRYGRYQPNQTRRVWNWIKKNYTKKKGKQYA